MVAQNYVLSFSSEFDMSVAILKAMGNIYFRNYESRCDFMSLFLLLFSIIGFTLQFFLYSVMCCNTNENNNFFFEAQTLTNVFDKPSIFFTSEPYSDYVSESYKMYEIVIECKLTKTCDQKMWIVICVSNY